MKKFFTMAFMSLAVLAVSCSKDKAEEQKAEDPKEEVVSIEGTWGIESSILIEEGKPYTKTPDECEKKLTWNFSQGKLKSVSYPKKNGKCEEAEIINGTYTISGDKLTFVEEGKKSETGTFSVDKTTLKITTERGSSFTFKRK